MSRINDALKKVQNAPPPNTPTAMPPVRPPVDEPSVLGWLIPAFIIVLIFAGIFFIGWACAHHNIHSVINVQDSTDTQTNADVAMPVAVAHVPDPPLATNAIYVPHVQGIFYSPTTPTAILDGKSVGVGDKIAGYNVKEISKYAVILVNSNGQENKVSLGH